MNQKYADLFPSELLEEACEQTRTRGTMPGVDGVDARHFEASLAYQLESLRADLLEDNYSPQAYRRFYLPKTNGGTRPIVVATMRDRVLQTAVLLLLGYEAERLFASCCYAYRKNRGIQHAYAEVGRFRDAGFQEVLRADIENFFDTVPREPLFRRLTQIDVDSAIVDLFRRWLAAAIVEPTGAIVNSDVGLPQGLPVSPLLANLYLTPLDHAAVDANLNFVRYADDLLLCCKTPEEVDAGAEFLRAKLDELGLRLSQEKTTKTNFATGFEFLGAAFLDDKIVVQPAPHPYEREFKPPKSRKRVAPLALPRVMTRTLYLQRQGSTLARKGGGFVARLGKQTLLEIPIVDVDQIYVFGAVQITTPAMGLCLENDVPLHLFSQQGRYYGVLRAPARSNLTVKAAQIRLYADQGARLAFGKKIVETKIRNSRTFLMKFVRRHPEVEERVAKPLERMKDFVDDVDKSESLAQLNGVEGMAARFYFEAFGNCLLSPEFSFCARIKRPPLDPVNSMLSFAYSLVLYRIDACMAARGIDSTIGLMHESRGYPALAYDLLEEFRAPLVDAFVLYCVNKKIVSPEDFYFAEGDPQPCFLKDESRPKFLKAFEEKLNDQRAHPDAVDAVDWRRVLDLQVCRLRRFFEGEVDSYAPLEIK